MANSWDLMILDPIVILLGFLLLGFLVFRERTSLKWVLYFASTLCFWMGTAIVFNMNTIQFESAVFSTPVFGVLLFFGSSTLISLFLKPLAAWLTTKVHWRKWWILLSFMGLFFSLILTVVNQQFNAIAIYVVVALTLGFGLSANSLFYLTLNEQFYYRIAPILSSILVSTIIGFAAFFGNFLVNLEASLFPVGERQFLVLSIILGFVFLIIFGVIFGFFSSEDKTYVRSFELTQLEGLPKYNVKKLLYLVFSLLALGIFFGLTQSSLVTDYLQTLFMSYGYSWESSAPWVRSFSQLFIVPQFFLGYVIYKTLATKIGYKPILLGAFGLSLVAIILMAFLDNPYLYVIFNFILGLTFSQVFYSFFGIAMMWNYRTKDVPVSGYAIISSLAGSYVINVIIELCKSAQVGIFKDYVNGQLNPEQVIDFQLAASPIVVISYAVLGTFCIFAIVGLFFSFQYLFADYSLLTPASQNARMMLRVQQREKSRTRIFVNEVKID